MPRTITKTFQVTIPAGTAKATPVTLPTTFEPNIVDSIEWTFPHGCNGKVGIQIGARSVPVLPGDRAQFYTTSGDTHAIGLDGHHDSGDWSVIGYNTGQFNHTVQVVFVVHRIEPLPEPEVTWLDSELTYSHPPFQGS